jgi:hypothetical protein
MDMILGVTTCDKCFEPLEKGQNIITIGSSTVDSSNDKLEISAPEIRYACHLECWDGVE